MNEKWTKHPKVIPYETNFTIIVDIVSFFYDAYYKKINIKHPNRKIYGEAKVSKNDYDQMLFIFHSDPPNPGAKYSCTAENGSFNFEEGKAYSVHHLIKNDRLRLGIKICIFEGEDIPEHSKILAMMTPAFENNVYVRDSDQRLKIENMLYKSVRKNMCQVRLNEGLRTFVHKKAFLYETNYTWIVDNISFLNTKIRSPEFEVNYAGQKIKTAIYLLKGPKNFDYFLDTSDKCVYVFGDIKFNTVNHSIKDDRLTGNLKIQLIGERYEREFGPSIDDNFGFTDLLRPFFNSTDLSDVILKIEGKEIPAHSQLLAMRSSVFKEQFAGKQDFDKYLSIENISYKIAFEMFRFIYSNEVENLEDLSRDLLVAATLYEIEFLKRMCLDSIEKNLSVNNVIELFDFACENSISELKMSTVCFMRINLKLLKNSLEFQRLILNPHFLETAFS